MSKRKSVDGADQSDQRPAAEANGNQRPTAEVRPLVTTGQQPEAKRARQDLEGAALEKLVLPGGRKGDVEVAKNGIWSPAFSIKERRFGYSPNLYLNPVFPPRCCEKRGKGEPRAPPCSPTGKKLYSIQENRLLEAVFGMMKI